MSNQFGPMCIKCNVTCITECTIRVFYIVRVFLILMVHIFVIWQTIMISWLYLLCIIRPTVSVKVGWKQITVLYVPLNLAYRASFHDLKELHALIHQA